MFLNYSGEDKFGTDEMTFNSILATTNWAQLRQVMALYFAAHGHTLQKAVAAEFSFNVEKGLITICKTFTFFKNIKKTLN